MDTSAPRAWIGWSLVSGCAAALPAGWLLAYLAVAPFFLGLLAFLVVGLLIGAVMFRFGRRAAPAPRAVLWLIGTAVVILVWGTGLAIEYDQVFGDAARAVRDSFGYRSFTEQERARIYDETRRYVLSQLTGGRFENGRLGYLCGFPGYLTWAASSGTMECPRLFSPSTQTFYLAHRRLGWLTRVILSLLFLGFTVLSQILSLAEAPKPPDGTANAADADCEG